MDSEKAWRFAEEWAADWNAHDLDRVMRHFAADVEFRSPLAARLVEGSGGVIRGADALRAYWADGLHRHPHLHFEIVGVYAGIDTVVINYRNHVEELVNEVLIFRNDLVVMGLAAYTAPR